MKNTDNFKLNTSSVISIFKYLEDRIIWRLSKELKSETLEPPTLELEKNDSPIAKFIVKHQLFYDEIVLLLLVLVPNVDPNFLNNTISKVLPEGGEFPEFGGVKGKNHRGILPTGETALYILYGNEMDDRISGIESIKRKGCLFKENIILLESVPNGEPEMSGKLYISDEHLSILFTGVELKPNLSQHFPASLIETSMEWNDLILKDKTIAEVKEIETWLSCNSILMNDWGMKKKISPGYRVLFYGPPGTGKTLTASLLGKSTKKDVYRIDLSMVVSKYIGETEKNLSNLFDRAINKNWILFFDEADALFGKRTNVKDAHDAHANQQVSYLLQRIETYPGLVILASNFKSNIDSAFARRFQSMIHFEVPSYIERLKLWETSLPQNIHLEDDLKIEDLAKNYSVTGASIINVVQHACLKTIDGNHKSIQSKFIIEGIKREYNKEGRSLTIA